MASLLTAILSFFSMRRRTKPRADDGALYSGYAIPVTEEQLELERQSNEEVIKLLEANVVAS